MNIQTYCPEHSHQSTASALITRLTDSTNYNITALIPAHLFLQEVGHTGPLLLGDGGQDLVRHAEVPPHHGGLVLQDGHQQGVGDDVELLVPQVEAVVLGDVAQEVHGPAMGGGHT